MKNTFGSLVIPLVGVAVFCASTARSADASPITLQFTSTVKFINPLAAGFPGSLAGVIVGDPITGTLTFDPATVSSVNPFPGTFGDATLYSLPTASFSVDIDGVLFNTWTGIISAFVWDNDSISPGRDGVIFTNITGFGNPLFQFGNTNLFSSTFGDESLPTGPLGPVLFEISQIQNSGPVAVWLQSETFTATEASAAPVPEPATLFLLGTGVAVAARRRFKARTVLQSEAEDGNPPA